MPPFLWRRKAKPSVTPLRVKQAMDANMATTAALASTDPDKGDAMVGSDDGASGTLWTTVKGFIAYLRSSAGSSIVNFLQSGTGAATRTVQAKLRERVSPLDFGAAGDADPDDNTAGTDDTAAVQACFDYAAENPGTAVCLAGKFYKIQNVRIPPRLDRRRWFVFGEGGGFVNPATSTSEAPCLFYSSLANSGDASRTYSYNVGVTLNEVNFHGGGYGVGYAHLIAGSIHHNNCSFQKLEDGLLTIGVAGIVGRNPVFNECARGAHAAALADYTFTAGYTQEASTKWNDGYSIDGGHIRECERGILHKGSVNEGVLKVSNMIWTGATESYVEVYSPMIAVDISHNWCEYTKADSNGDPVADCIRLYRSTGADSGGESPGRYSIHHNHFFLTAPNPVGGVDTYAVRRVINARVNCHIHDNVFTAANNAVYKCIIYNNIGTAGTPIANVTVTPNDTSTFNSAGRINFLDADLAPLGQKEGIFFMIHDDGKVYALSRQGTGAAGTSTYNLHAVGFVYGPQFAAVNDEWETKTGQTSRIAPIGFQIDWSTNVTGLTAPAGAVTVMAGLTGGVVNMATGAGAGGIALIERNVCQNIDMRLFYAQREFGRYIMRDNIKRT